MAEAGALQVASPLRDPVNTCVAVIKQVMALARNEQFHKKAGHALAARIEKLEVVLTGLQGKCAPSGELSNVVESLLRLFERAEEGMRDCSKTLLYRVLHSARLKQELEDVNRALSEVRADVMLAVGVDCRVQLEAFRAPLPPDDDSTSGPSRFQELEGSPPVWAYTEGLLTATGLIQKLWEKQLVTAEEVRALKEDLSDQSAEGDADASALLLQVEQLLSVTESTAGTARAPLPVRVPRSFLCPITLDLMWDPVVLFESGQTYERRALQRWFEEGHRTDPVTRAAVENPGMLVPVYALRAAIREHLHGVPPFRDLTEEDWPAANVQFEAAPCMRPGTSKGLGKRARADAGPTAEELFREGKACVKGVGRPRDAARGALLLQRAVEQGHAGAQDSLGDCYYDGTGVAKDPQQAVAWYRKAAEQGHASGQSSLGYCYRHGVGVAEDAEQAVTWYRKAAEQGDARGQNSLGLCYEEVVGVAKDARQAVAWYRKAANQGDAAAQYNLADCYEHGVGVAKDAQQAILWYRKAAEQGQENAKAAVIRLSKRASRHKSWQLW